MVARAAKVVAIAALVIFLTPLAGVHLLLRSSLPQLDGRIDVTGLSAPVTIERDALGVPTVQAANRADLAFGTGFVHGQDRFFQIDLSRRLAAGELSALFGEAAVKQDSAARIFRFRRHAREVLASATPEQRAVLEAYARGVNAGVASLRSRPWEYWVLRAEPAEWQPEDTFLAAYAMWWDLQYAGFTREMVRLQINERLGGPVCEHDWKCALSFLYPARTEWDAPNVLAESALSGSSVTQSETSVQVPPPEVLDIRGTQPTTQLRVGQRRPPVIGSNNWAVAGSLTPHGSALVANDMHLRLRVPTIWYRARLRLTGIGEDSLDLNGVTLPGAPLLIAGSNGHIAWGFTNAYGDWLDLQAVDCDQAGEMSVENETIEVRDSKPVVVPVRQSAYGVLLSEEEDGRRCWFATWLAQVPAATNLNLMQFERARSVEEALRRAPEIGIPHQNLVVGDRAGNIGWTVLGRIPADISMNRNTGRSAWRTAEEYPRIVNPATGRIWTANSRPVDDPAAMQAIAGDEAAIGAEFDLGARATQIRDALLALERNVMPADMLKIQLDDRTLLLARWRQFLLELLDEEALREQPRRAELRRLLENWNGRALPDAAGFQLVREFRDRTEDALWQMILQALDIESDAPPPMQFEAPLWTLVTTRPEHMLALNYGSWREFLLEQVDQTLESEELTRNQHVKIRHPLSSALPFLSKLIDMPEYALPGDTDLPRVQRGAFGASERFAVAPGFEQEGYLHIAGGQSGHPLSPYYRAGFDAWVRGEPLPFLPGEPEHRLTLHSVGSVSHQ